MIWLLYLYVGDVTHSASSFLLCCCCLVHLRALSRSLEEYLVLWHTIPPIRHRSRLFVHFFIAGCCASTSNRKLSSNRRSWSTTIRFLQLELTRCHTLEFCRTISVPFHNNAASSFKQPIENASNDWTKIYDGNHVSLLRVYHSASKVDLSAPVVYSFRHFDLGFALSRSTLPHRIREDSNLANCSCV